MELMELQKAGLLLSGAIYVGSVLWLWRGLSGRRSGPVLADDQPAVSVLVAARDEEATLPRCLAALARQDYQGAFEVIVVDDRSRDRTWELIAAKAVTWPELKGVQAAPDGRFKCPKKSALAEGIAASSGEILLFTDADCRPPADWVSSMVAHFAPGVGLVAGYARPDPVSGVLAKVLAVDNIGVGALGAGSFGMGHPLSCTGRSLGYRRQVYDELGGFAQIGHLIGGDDVYFMRLLSAQGQWAMAFNRQAVVLSQPPPAKFADAIQQKLRHAAKGGHYKGRAFYLAVGVYLFHGFLAWGMVQILWTQSWDSWVAGVWFTRWAVDFLLLKRMATPEERPLLRYLPLAEVLYIPYVLIFTVVGRWGWFRWKT